MTSLIDQVTEAFGATKAPFHYDPENEVVLTSLPTDWSHGTLMVKSGDDSSIDLMAMVGGEVPRGAHSMVEETLQKLNGYCKYARFGFDSDHSRIALHAACPVIGGFKPEHLFFLIAAMAAYWDRFGYAVQSVIRENTTPDDAVRVVVNA